MVDPIPEAVLEERVIDILETFWSSLTFSVTTFLVRVEETLTLVSVSLSSPLIVTTFSLFERVTWSEDNGWTEPLLYATLYLSSSNAW